MVTSVPQSSYEELSELLGDEDEIESFDEANNIKIVTKRVDEGFQQIVTHKEWVSDKIGKRTTTMVRLYKPCVEDEEEVEEDVQEEEINEEQLAELRAKAPPPPAVTDEVVTGKDGKKKKKKQKVEGASDIVREAFEGGYKEIITTIFPDGSQKKTTKFFYDAVEVPKSEQQVVEETTTTKSGKKKKVKKIINLNQEVIEQYEDDDGNEVTVTREPFPDGSGHKEIKITKLPKGGHKSVTNIIFYPKEKEVIETSEILVHEPTSIRMVLKERVIKSQYNEESLEESETTSSSKKTKKKSSKKAVAEQQSIDEEEVAQVQVQQVQVQQIQESQENGQFETKKITKKTTKKVLEEQQKAALMARDNSEGVTTVVREKTEKGYREISTTVFSDGSTKTSTREFYDAVEEQVDHEQAMAIRNNLAVLASQPPQVQKNADGSTSTIVVERINNGFRQTTTTKKLNGATSVQTREFYDAVEEETSESGQQTRRVVQSKQQIQGVQNNMMKSVKLFG